MAGRKKEHTIKRENINGKYWLIERDSKGKVTSKAKWYSNEIERSKSKNKIQTSRTKRYFQTKVKELGITGIKRRDIYEQLKQATKEIQKKETIREYQTLIDKERQIHIGRIEVATRGIINRQKANKMYKKLLWDKIDIKDEKKKEEKINKIIANKDKLLKKRFIVTAELYTKDGAIGIINIGDTLPETDVDINNYWKGRTIESNQFPIDAEEFRRIIGNPRIYTAKQTSIKAGEITQVKTTWTFA